MTDRAALTRAYIAAFDARDPSRIAPLLADGFALEDPVVKRIEGRDAALKAMADIFASCETLSFSARNIFVDGDTSLIEFDLHLDQTHLKGVDVIQWRGDQMAELRAYLDIPK